MRLGLKERNVSVFLCLQDFFPQLPEAGLRMLMRKEAPGARWKLTVHFSILFCAVKDLFRLEAFLPLAVPRILPVEVDKVNSPLQRNSSIFKAF